MNIENYFDVNFLKDIASNKNALQKICNEDNGFIFKKFQDFNILPEKNIIGNIVNSHAAIIFLFDNYPITDKDYIKFSSFFNDNSITVKLMHEKNTISKNVIINEFFDENKNFTHPGFFLTKDDFVKYENLINTIKLSEIKIQYLIDSFLSFKQEDIKKIPLSIFANNIYLYDYSAKYLFDEKPHLNNYKSNVNKSNCNFNVFLEYIKRVDDIHFIKNLSAFYLNKDNIKKMCVLLKKRNEKFTINDIFPYFNLTIKMEIIQYNYTEDFNPQILVDMYINKIENLERDSDYTIYKNIKKMNLPINLKHYFTLLDSSENIYLSLIEGNPIKIEDIEKIINLLEHKTETSFIDLSKLIFMPRIFKSFYSDCTHEILENTKGIECLSLNMQLIKKVVSLYYNQVFADNNSLIDDIPLEIFNIIYENTESSLNKFIWLSSVTNNNIHLAILSDGIKELPVEFHNDLLLLINKKPLSLDSTLFKTDCVLKLKEINTVPHLNEKHLKILPENTLKSYFDKGALVKDETWEYVLEIFNSKYILNNWQLHYLEKNFQRKDNGPVFMKLINKIEKGHENLTFILTRLKDNNLILSEIYRICEEKLKFINDENNYLNNIENYMNEFHLRFQSLNEAKKNEIIKSINPSNIYEVIAIMQIIGKEDFLNNYILSQHDKEIISRDSHIISSKTFSYLIKPDFWKKQDSVIKKQIFKYALNGLKNKDFYLIFNLIDFNDSKCDIKLKNHIIKKYSDKLLFDSSKLASIWNYNMEDLYHMFEYIDKKNNWNFTQIAETSPLLIHLFKLESVPHTFSNLVENAIKNSSTKMFWEVLDRAKQESPSIYTVLANPLAIYNKMNSNKDFLLEEFNIFKEKFTDKQNKNNLSAYLYIYDIIDSNIVVKGINNIRQSFSIGAVNNYINDAFYKENSIKDLFHNNMFAFLSSICSDVNDVYINPEKIKKIINDLIELDCSNFNIIISFPNLISIYGKSDFLLLILDKIKSVEIFNNIFLRNVSSTYYDIDGKLKNSKSYFQKHTHRDTLRFYSDLFESFARIKAENSLFLSYIYKQKEIFDNSFNSIKGIEIYLKGDFQILDFLGNSEFGKNIHIFAKDFYKASKLQKIITEKIEDMVDIGKSKSDMLAEYVFKL